MGNKAGGTGTAAEYEIKSYNGKGDETMKLKKVAALCSRQGAFYLYDQISESGEIRQWLGDGQAIYLLSGLPILTDENLCAMFDITEAKRKKCSFRREAIPSTINVDDWEQGELALNDNWPTVEHNGYVIKPLSTWKQITFIQNAYLDPLEDMADYLRLYERRGTSGHPYIVAKNGMETAAVIMAFDAIEQDFVEKLEQLASMCRATMEMQKANERVWRDQEDIDQDQSTMFPNTGEAEEDAANEETDAVCAQCTGAVNPGC